MKKFLDLLSLDIKQVCRRFPLTCLCVFMVFVSMLVILEIYDIEIIRYNKKLLQLLWTLICCGTLFFAFKIFNEFNTKKIHFVVQFIPAGLIAFHILTFDTIRGDDLFLLFGGLILLAMTAPFLNKDISTLQDEFWLFNVKLIVRAVFSGIAMLILCAGLSFIIYSILSLFEIETQGIKVIKTIWVLGFTLLGPVLFLGGIPKTLEITSETLSKLAIFIAKYIVVPLLAVYLVILYVYFIKIGINWELPRGNLTYLILTFSIVGIITYLAFYVAREKVEIIHIFTQYFFKTLVIPVSVLFLAVWVRIKDYGITEDRYIVVMLALWLGIISVYFLFKKNIILIPLVLSVLMILASFGPWSAYNISLSSQINRLEKTLSEKNILVNGKIVPSRQEVSFEERKNISSVIDYLNKRNQLDEIAQWFPKDNVIVKTKEDEWLESAKVMEEMGLEYVYDFHQFDYSSHYSYDSNTKVLDVEGYTSLISASLYDDGESVNISGMNIKLDDGILVITNRGIKTEFDLEDKANSLYLKKENEVTEADMTMIKNNIKLRITSIGFKKEGAKIKPRINYLNFYIMY